MKYEALRFVLVGIFSTFINYSVYFFLFVSGASLVFASVGGYAAGLFISFFLGRSWVFNVTEGRLRTAVLRFFFVYFVGGAGMVAIIKGIDYWLGWSYQGCWFAGVAFSLLNNFLGSKFLVFKRVEH